MSKLFLLCSLLLTFSTTVFAVNSNFSGFIGGNLPIVDVPIGKKQYYDFGLLHTMDINENFSTTVQLNYTGVERVEDVLTFGFVSLNECINSVPFNLSVGKFRIEHGLYGGDLTNPRLRPTMLPPQSIYLQGIKYNIRSAYGIKLDVFFGDFEFSADWGKPIVHDQESEFFTWLNLPYSFVRLPESQKRMTEDWGGIYTMFLKHEVDWNTFKIAYGQVSLGNFVGVEYFNFGDEIRWKDFALSAETMWVNPYERFSGKNITFFDFDHLSKGHSFTLSYTLDKFKFYGNYNFYESQSPLPKFVQQSKARWEDRVIGAMYNVTDDLLLRAEYHFIEGSRMFPIPQTLTSDKYDSYNMAIIGLTYFF